MRIQRDAYRDGDPAQLLPTLTKFVGGSDAVGSATGMIRMMIAAIEAREAPTLSHAQQIVTNVDLAPDDFPWLQDVRTLAVADAAHRFGIAEIEQERIATFVERQPLLFEPDIALEFWLLDAQERLKH